MNCESKVFYITNKNEALSTNAPFYLMETGF